jgi:hypothetical protein
MLQSKGNLGIKKVTNELICICDENADFDYHQNKARFANQQR